MLPSAPPRLRPRGEESVKRCLATLISKSSPLGIAVQRPAGSIQWAGGVRARPLRGSSLPLTAYWWMWGKPQDLKKQDSSPSFATFFAKVTNVRKATAGRLESLGELRAGQARFLFGWGTQGVALGCGI